MVGIELLLINSNRSQIQGLGLGISPLALIKRRQSIQALGDIRVIQTKRLFTERQRSFVQYLSFRKTCGK